MFGFLKPQWNKANLKQIVLAVAKTTIYILTPIEPESIVGKSFCLNKEDNPKSRRYLRDSALRDFVYSSNIPPNISDNAVLTDEGLIFDIEYYTSNPLKSFRFKILTVYGTRYIEWFDLFDRDLIGNFHLKENILIE